MRYVLALPLLLAVGGCAGSIFDPAPYRPAVDKSVLQMHSPAYDQVTILEFASLEDAAYKLKALGSGYADARDTIMRQQLLVDIPAIGLGVATVANGVFRGAKDATIALGLSSATVAGTRLYFGPQVKVVAYNNASSALECASSVATVMNVESQSDGEAGASIAQSLTSYLALADDRITSGKLSKQDSTTLLAARDAAQKSLADLNGALSTIGNAPAQLQSFAVTVIRGATTKVVTGTQNVDAVLTLIKGSTSGTTAPKAPAAAAPAKGGGALPLALN